MKDKFIDFLIENNVFDTYVEYTPYPDNFLRHSIPEAYLRDAFLWCFTNERTLVWAELNKKWLQIVNQQEE